MIVQANQTIKPLLIFIVIGFFFPGCRKEIDVPLKIDFEYSVIDNNYNVPVRIVFINKTSGALFYKWTFPTADVTGSNYKDPGYITFTQPGPITVKLEAWNDYDRDEKTIQIVLDTLPVANFSAVPRLNNYAPVEWDFNFTGQGATRFKWSFENGSVTTSTDRNPRQILYSLPGVYKVVLEIFNDRNKADSLTKFITVKPPLNASFDILPSFDDDDFEVPFTAQLDNHTISAVSHRWEATGGNFSNATDSIPTVQFTTPGTHTITYTATNGKQTQVVSKSITLYPNSNLRTFSNVKLGINTAHQTTGSFFSTYLRKVIKKDSVNAVNGPHIDICYFGLSQSFSFNKFLSPRDVQNWTFDPIPGARDNVVINKQEDCSCGINVTPAQFETISNGSFFDGLSIVQTTGGLSDFDNTLVPRVILFKNAAGRKGAIKISRFVDDGANSYLLCDIKIQKE
ncbi:MAG TPA: hypothetical protein VF487_09875 [Chitinophagaceae bacterium]